MDTFNYSPIKFLLLFSLFFCVSESQAMDSNEESSEGSSISTITKICGGLAIAAIGIYIIYKIINGKNQKIRELKNKLSKAGEDYKRLKELSKKPNFLEKTGKTLRHPKAYPKRMEADTKEKEKLDENLTSLSSPQSRRIRELEKQLAELKAKSNSQKSVTQYSVFNSNTQK